MISCMMYHPSAKKSRYLGHIWAILDVFRPFSADFSHFRAFHRFFHILHISTIFLLFPCFGGFSGTFHALNKKSA